MDKYLIMVINEDGTEILYTYETNRGVFAAVEAIMQKHVKRGPLNQAVQLHAKKVTDE